MDYEKKYKEALEKAKELQHDNCWVTTIFPELKESEDERIRKAIIMFFELQDDNTTYSFIPKKDILAWLEKQGEQKHDNVEPKFKVGDTIKYFGERQELSEAKHTIKEMKNDMYVTTLGALIPLKYEGNYELVEQKPADKVEPKFKAGDVMRTLQEAADNIIDGLPVVVSIDATSYRCTNEIIDIKDQDNYEYPPINRRQKPAWSEEDEAAYYGVIETEQYMLDVVNGIKKFDVGNISIKEECAKELNWLKSLKDRVQPKHEWSDEDEDLYNRIVRSYTSYENRIIQAKDLSDDNRNNILTDLEEQEIWLRDRIKSIRPQNTWKPSDEQMKALWEVYKGGKEQASLATLYSDLKKLREE